jgi:hypothetical protein
MGQPVCEPAEKREGCDIVVPSVLCQKISILLLATQRWLEMASRSSCFLCGSVRLPSLYCHGNLIYVATTWLRAFVFAFLVREWNLFRTVTGRWRR